MTMQRDRKWHKSSYSTANGSCAEVAEGETVLVRDTQNRGLGHIEYPLTAWISFLRDLKSGLF
ncbi:DUF397 domain-containing protein [Nocardiopsis ansamitocini]|uniref:DUF397 domain-containing protein n=1 Tax=Nocardiopsis ansamitocini TaxID=1670832 RepID=A0A9W6P4B3_9ACTN|nr:DUF397 domain-containing protein [Nocardiopsis ansamitocini]GLU46965.1 hypothetical protein Nans01_13160 [Nocardiopsis ansamitocini]